MAHGVATAGHRSDQMGLRGHSVGDVFPMVLFMKGMFDDLTHWVLQPNGLEIGPFATYDKAHGLATRLKMFGQLSKDDPATPDIIQRETAQQYDYFGDITEPMDSTWRWRIPTGAEATDRVEYSSNGGDTWTRSRLTARELRTTADFICIGDNPQWQVPSTRS